MNALVVVPFILLVSPTVTRAQVAPAGQVIVEVARASDRAGVEEVLHHEGWSVVDELPALGLLLVELPEAVSESSAIARLADVPGVGYAEPNGSGEGGAILPGDPNDTWFGDQWPLENTGQFGGRIGADIEARRGWELARGSASVIVAVLDSGIIPDHPEFAGRVLPGWDFINNDADPFDDHGHGTAVSGILAANANNAFGLAGVDHACLLLPIKLLNQFNGGSTFTLARGLIYAADAGADVINMSLINYSGGSTLNNAIGYARQAGCVLIACAGNGGIGDADRSFPGRSSFTISVGATTRLDERAWYSGTGQSLDLVAPSDGAPATVTDPLWDGYGNFGGCSGATPIVSGIASVMLSVDPTLTHDEIQQLLQAGAEDQVGDPAFDILGRDDHYGHGRANLFRSLCGLDTGGPTILGPDVLRVDSSGPSGASGGDPAVSAALAGILVVDDLDPTPKVHAVAPDELPFGEPVPMTVTALDACGHTSTRTLAIVAADLSAPRLVLGLERERLEPASGALVPVGLRITAEDACDATPEVELRVYADEPSPRGTFDAAFDASRQLCLRGTHAASGDGRVYLLLVRARDEARNEALAAATVVVPRDGSPAALALVLEQATQAESASLASGAPPPGFVELHPIPLAPRATRPTR